MKSRLRVGRFGPYVQLGEGKDEEKPKRSSIPKGTDIAALDLPMALKLLALPREVGKHPETGEPIKANIGRFGPYVQHEKTYANLDDGDDPLTIGLNRAVTLIAEKIAKGPSKRRFGADPGRPLGDHPQKGGPITVKKGKYGPYVSHNGVNATIPEVQDPAIITLEDAIALLDARAGKSHGQAEPAPGRGPQIACSGQEGSCQAGGEGQGTCSRKSQGAAMKPAPKAKAKAIVKAKAAR